MKIEKGFINNGLRYDFDLGKCSVSNGYAQIDTSLDAPYFGTWTNPFEFTTVIYCEGDVRTLIAENETEYTDYIRGLKERYDATDDEFKGIDAMLDKRLINRFNELRLSDLLH